MFNNTEYGLESPIDEKRYSEYNGSPYLFKENKTVDLYLIGNSKPYSVLLNINMQEKEIYYWGFR